MAMKYVSMPNCMVGIVALGSVVAHTAVLLVFQLGQPRIFFAMARDGFLPAGLRESASEVPDAARHDDPHRRARRRGAAFANIDEMVDLTNIGTLFAFILVCLGIIDPALQGPEPGAAVPGSARPRLPAGTRPALVRLPDLLPAADLVDAVLRVAAGRAS